MEILMFRDKSRDDEMLGDLWIDQKQGKAFCHTLEDEHRIDKIPGETAIPAGRYQIKYRPLGQSRMDKSYSERYDFYRGQLWLQDVPNFTYVYIHTGNNDDHTDGCILVGETKYVDTIGGSRIAYTKLYKLINEAFDAGEEVWIDIKNSA